MIRRAFLSVIPTIPFIGNLKIPNVTPTAETKSEKVKRLNILVKEAKSELLEIAMEDKPGEIARLQVIMDKAYGELVPEGYKEATPPSGKTKAEIIREFDAMPWDGNEKTLETKAAMFGLYCKLRLEYFILENGVGAIYFHKEKTKRPKINEVKDGKITCIAPYNPNRDAELLADYCSFSWLSPLGDTVVANMGYIWLTH